MLEIRPDGASRLCHRNNPVRPAIASRGTLRLHMHMHTRSRMPNLHVRTQTACASNDLLEVVELRARVVSPCDRRNALMTARGSVQKGVALLAIQFRRKRLVTGRHAALHAALEEISVISFQDAHRLGKPQIAFLLLYVAIAWGFGGQQATSVAPAPSCPHPQSLYNKTYCSLRHGRS